MKHIKLFEQDFDDPFGEEKYGSIEIGDKVVILDKRYGAKHEIGSIGIIVSMRPPHQAPPQSDIFSVKVGDRTYEYYGEDIRKVK